MRPARLRPASAHQARPGMEPEGPCSRHVEEERLPVPNNRGDGLWAPGRRALTTGLVLTDMFVAAEALAVVTVMPIVARDRTGRMSGMASGRVAGRNWRA
jgi:hypothetical protein